MTGSVDWAGRRVWITGASSGIGEALSRELAGRGAALILSGRRTEALDRLSAELGGDTLVLPFEATDYGALPDVVARAEVWRGGVDMLVNNAGVSQRSLAVDTAFEVYRELMEIDYFAPLRLTQLVLPGMIARRSGHLVAISSVAGRIGTPLRTGYCGAKHACIGYFDALRAELETSAGLNVTTVMPGYIRTSVSTNALTGDGSALGTTDGNIADGMGPQECARRIVDGLSSRAREIVVAGEQETLALRLRAGDPERLFDILAAEGGRLMAARGGTGVNATLAGDLISAER
jgi:short-subunit dehydrogenase